MEYLPKYITYGRKYNRYIFSRTIKGKNYKKTFRTFKSALEHLNAFDFLLHNDIENLNIIFD